MRNGLCINRFSLSRIVNIGRCADFTDFPNVSKSLNSIDMITK